MSRPLIIAGALSVLSACDPGPKAMPAKPPKPEAPAPVETGLVVTRAAVGPVTTTTPFNRDALQRMFRGSDVSLEFRDQGGVRTALIVVRGPDDLLIEFHGKDGTVAGAVVRGSDLRGAQGERIAGPFTWRAD